MTLRSHMTSDLKSVTSITLVCMCMLLFKWPLRLWRPPNDLEVTYDLTFEVNDLNYLCSHASLACKGFHEMIDTTDGRTANYDP